MKTTSDNKLPLKNYQVTTNLVVFLCPILKGIFALFSSYFTLFQYLFPQKNKSTNLVVSCKFYLLKLPTSAANQLVSKMEIITFESKAYKELDNKITAIADYIFNHTEAESTNEDEIWVDSYEVCTFLKISDRTLQRLRAAGTITYSNIKGHYFYKIGEIKRLLEERLIKRDKDSINDLITNHQLYVKERRNIRKDK